MSEEWQVLSLADAGVTLLDCDHKTPEAVDSGWPYVGIPQMTTGRVDFSTARRITHADFIAWTRKTKYQKDDVILSRRTNPGVTAIDDTGTEFALGQNLVLLRADGRKVYPPFLRWLVRGPEWWVQIEKFINVGAVFSSLRCRDVPNFELTIPPLPEQRAIAATLGALDDKIELNRKMNATLEAMARALFRDWFVDFGPTRAKMEGAAPYLSPDLWSLFPNRLDDEGKPEGWEVSTIGDFIELLDHKRVPLSSQERAKRQGPYPYHGATSVMDHIDSYLFDERILLLGEDGSVAKEDGRPFTQYVWGKLWVNNHAHVIKGRNMSVEQLKLFFDQIDIRPFVTGAVQPKLNQANLRRVPYLRASDAIHSAFDATIAPLYDLVRQLNEESRTLAQTRDLLLPRLMSGELRLAEAERAVEAAL
ncbi:restriction endonuclease subunit S [Paracoccus shanxieyensis]|uniref:Restriction endonuclease subunit S n=1 Tax=Paracoccus shanxieyensis TaxID=2675752 RepID=A0A6L6J456_9RHOB|nr:restriction endonuclease subunit S [Paracoccus shanxieyensis]MTH89313.1 restriction endonuclease subunit S [Paracoccus shanxieyensis]